MRKYFGTDGIRGKYGEFLTDELAYKVGIAAGSVFKPGACICIGMDTRESSIKILDQLVKGLSETGINVEILGVISTPVVSYEIINNDGKYSAGIMISASHNPYYDNGIKFFGNNGKKLSDELEYMIEAKLDSEITYIKKGSINYNNDSVNKYCEYIKSLGINLKGLKIGLDCANGSAAEIAPNIFRSLNAEIKVIGNNPDGRNINDKIGSTHPETIAKFVKENNLDFGFSYDGDADRIILIDGEGKILDGDYIIYLITKELKQNDQLKKNVCVGTVMANLGFKKALNQLDVDYLETQVGDRYVMQKLEECGGTIGGEQSGHIILPEFLPTGDGILTSVILAKIFKNDKLQLKNLNDELVKFPQVLRNIVVKDKNAIMNNEVINKVVEVQELSLNQEGRILVRSSGTESLVRVMVEAKNEKLCEEVILPIINKIEEYNV